MKHVVMLLSNAYRPDPRVEREAEALNMAGYKVTVIAWDRERQFPVRTVGDKTDIIRIHSVPTKYGLGWRQAWYFWQFWREAERIAQDLSPDYIHCHDLDTLYVGTKLRTLQEIPLVFDAHEDYPSLMSLYLPRIFLKFLSFFETKLLQSADHIITASTYLEEKYNNLGMRKTSTIGNYQDLVPYKEVTRQQIDHERAGMGFTPDSILISYIGGFTRNRLLIPFIRAADSNPDVDILLWGDGVQKTAVQAEAQARSNVHYYGWLPAVGIPLAASLSNSMFYCLLSDYPGAVYNSPNALSIAMAAGKPIIANDIGDLGRIVKENHCGKILTDVSTEAISSAIFELKDTTYSQKLGANALLAAEQKYNWQTARKLLTDLYESLSN